MQDVMRMLVEGIGTRFAGTESEHRAAKALNEAFAARGVQSRLQRFGFIGWRLLLDPSVQIVAPQRRTCSAAPIIYSASTPRGGVRGQVLFHGRKTLIAGLYEMDTYAVVGSDGNYLAELIVEPGGPAIPLLNPEPIFRLPLVVIGAADHTFLQQALKTGQTITAAVEIETELLPDAVGYNVIAEYRGRPETSDRVVVDAHYDTQLDTPGAYDNASGVAGLFGVLDALQSMNLPINVDLVAVSGEEIGMHGSTYFVRDLKERGQLESINACICLDQISAGDTMWIWATEGAFREAALAAAKSAGLGQLGPIRVDDPMPGCDMWPFHLQRIPSCLYMWWRLPDYHKATDAMDKVEEPKLVGVVQATVNLLRTLVNDSGHNLTVYANQAAEGTRPQIIEVQDPEPNLSDA